MGGDNKTSTVDTSSATPAITGTVNKLATGLGNAYDAGSPGAFGKSLFQPAGATTQAGWTSTLGAANNQNYTNGVNGAISSFADTAAGKNFGTNDPGYAAMRAQVGDDTLRDVNSMFTSSGRFGSGSHVRDAAESLGSVYANMDYTNHQNDINRQQQAAAALPGMYSAALMPGSVQGAIGAAQDANASGILQGENDLWNRQTNAQTDWLAKLTSILGGNAAAGGTSSTSTTPSTPIWQSLLGAAVGLA